MIGDKKYQELQAKMEELGILESDIEEKATLPSGRGGQKMQKTATCIQLTHKPTGIKVSCQKERSKEMNRFFARRRLVEKFEEITLGKKSPKSLQAEKIRKQKKRRKRRLTH